MILPFRRKIRTAGTLAALALLGTSIYGMSAASRPGAQVQLGAGQQYSLHESTSARKRLPASHHVLAGDGSLDIAQRAFRDAQMQADALRNVYARQGLRMENAKITIDGIDAAESDRVRSLARMLPYNERNKEAYFCPAQNTVLSYCTEHHLKLGTPERPSVIYTDVVINYDLVRDHIFAAQKHAVQLPSQSMESYSLPALGAAAGVFAATRQLRARPRVQPYRSPRTQQRRHVPVPIIIDAVATVEEQSGQYRARAAAASTYTAHAPHTRYKYTAAMEQFLREQR